MNNLDYTLHSGDYGTTFDLEIRDGDTVLDPSVFSSGSHVFRLPDQTTFIKASGSIITSSGSYFRYTSVEGDIVQTGIWTLQAVVTDGVGKWRSDVWQFAVYPNLA